MTNGEDRQDPLPLTRKDIHEHAIEEHLERINREFRRGFEFLEKYPRSVSIFGSSMASRDSEHYRNAYELAKRIVAETGYAVISGGGPGIMEAANKGAFEAGGPSIGLRINLVRERIANPYETDGLDFTYFFARKTMLTFAAEAYIFCPGGFGTFDELFSILTLIQTNKIPRVPILLFGAGFWAPMKGFIEKVMYEGYHAIDHPDMGLFEITDSADHIVETIKSAPTSDWWRNIN
ncbi:MAG: TIGR00730 family Rossman fold protein [Patescibacteria group bacterium]|nr:TIGR00730 family Rossman fold protein [Patescibacteria group bacterium]